MGKETVSRLCEEQIEDFKKAVVLKYVDVDSEGVSYNALIWADEMLENIDKLAKAELNENGSIGYTLPDGKYHIYIYVESYDTDGSYFYVVEPNRVVDGAHKPMGTNVVGAEYDNFEELLKCCDWCLAEFAKDRERGNAKNSVEKVLSDAQQRASVSDCCFDSKDIEKE